MGKKKNPFKKAGAWLKKKADQVVNWVDEKIIKPVVNTVKAILKDPLPFIAQVAGSFMGIPPYVTSAAITAMRGGDIKDIAKSAAVAYIGSKAFSSTSYGKAFGEAGSSVNDFTADFASKFNLSTTTQTVLGNAAQSGFTNATLGGVRALITGQNVGDAITGGFTQGAVSGASNSYFSDINTQKDWGLTPDTAKHVSGMTASIGNALVTGGDPEKAISNYVSFATSQTIDSEFKKGAKYLWDQTKELAGVTDNSKKTYDAVQARYDKVAADLQNKVNEFNAEREKINAAREPYVNAYNTNLAEYNKNKAIYDDASKSVEERNAAVEKMNTYAAEVKKAVDGANSFNPQLEALNKKADDIASIKQSLTDPKTGIASELEVAANNLSSSYHQYNKKLEDAKVADDEYGKQVAEVATREALIDAVKNGSIKIVENPNAPPGSVTLENGVVITEDGRYLQDGKELFKYAVGIKQSELNPDSLFTDKEEVIDAFKGTGFTPTVEDIARFAGAKPENMQIKAIKEYADLNVTDLPEARQIYKDVYGKEGTDDQVKDFVGQTPEENVLKAILNNFNSDVRSYDDLYGDYQGAIEAPKDKISFNDAFKEARKKLGPGGEFTWTNAKGVTGTYTTGTADELKAQEIADQKRIDLMPVYGGSSNTRTGTPAGKEATYIDTRTGDVVIDTREFDSLGNVISGSLDLADKDSTTAALNTAVGSAVRTALDVGSGFIKGGGNLLEQVGTAAGLLGADMDNVVRMTGKQIQKSVNEMRSDEFKDKQNVINKAIQAAGGEGNFAQIVETFKQGGANPVQTAAFIIEQGTTLLVGGGAMTAARALGAGMTVAEASALAANAITQGSSVASEVYDDNIKMGLSQEDALTRARAAGALSTFTSAIANKFIPGALSNETKIAYGGAAKDSLKKALVGEISSEEAEELSGKVIGNMLSGKSWDTDLGTTAVHALVGSGVITGAVHVANNELDPIKATPKSQFDDVSAIQFNAAYDTLLDEGYTAPTTKELIDIINSSENKTEEDISKLALRYADPLSVTMDEVKAAFAAEGILNPTKKEIADYIGIKNEEETFKSLIEYADPRALTTKEVEDLFRQQGYTPTKQEIDEFVNYILEPDQSANINPNVDPNVDPNANPNVDPNVNPNVDPNVNPNINPNYETRVSNILATKYDPLATSAEEIESIYKELGYEPTYPEIDQFIGNMPEAQQLDLARQYGQKRLDVASKRRRNQYGQLMLEGEEQEGPSIITPTADVFYYGKDFSSNPQQISESGQVAPYRPVDMSSFGPDYDAMLGLPKGTLSALPIVQAAGVMPPTTGIAPAPNTGENVPTTPPATPTTKPAPKTLEELLSTDTELTEEDLMRILQEHSRELVP